MENELIKIRFTVVSWVRFFNKTKTIIRLLTIVTPWNSDHFHFSRGQYNFNIYDLFMTACTESVHIRLVTN